MNELWMKAYISVLVIKNGIIGENFITFRGSNQKIEQKMWVANYFYSLLYAGFIQKSKVIIMLQRRIEGA